MTQTDKVTDTADMAEYISDTRQMRLSRVQQMSSDEFTRIEKHLKRKLDIRLTGMIVFIYILNYLDRVSSLFAPQSLFIQHADFIHQNNIAASKIAGIEDDLHLTPTQFSTAVSLLFVSTMSSKAICT